MHLAGDDLDVDVAGGLQVLALGLDGILDGDLHRRLLALALIGLGGGLLGRLGLVGRLVVLRAVRLGVRVAVRAGVRVAVALRLAVAVVGGLVSRGLGLLGLDWRFRVSKASLKWECVGYYSRRHRSRWSR